jgi:nitroreductase
MNKNILENIIAAAIKAPSGDNVQPWSFQVSEDYSSLNLYNLPERDDSYYNYQQAAAYVTHGAVLENIAIASDHFGYMADIQLFPTPEDPNHVATINFQATKSKHDPLFTAIFSRSTNRFHYRTERLSLDDQQKLTDSVTHIEGIKTYLTSDPSLIKKLAIALMINDRLVFERENIHGFLFDKIRWNQLQINQTQDGMPLDTLGLSGIEKKFFPMMRFWQFVKFANHFGLSRIIGIKCWFNCYNAAGIGQITVKKTDRQGFIQVGRAMQHIWLEAERQGLAFQPIIGLPLLIYRAKNQDLGDFSEQQRKMVNNAEKHLRELFHIQTDEELIVGFRIGKGPEIAAKTLRKPVKLP